MRFAELMPNPPTRPSLPAEAYVWIIRIVFVAVLLGAWELAAAQSWVNPVYSGRPSVIAQRVLDLLSSTTSPNGLWVDVLTTGFEAAAGFIVGTVAGFLIGFAFVLHG